ncbi:MAG: DM13 domain-containing protein [Candidatus Promineifilaceae bacterium]
MKKALLIIIPVGLIGLIVVAAVGWYLISPLFINDKVDEAFPFEVPTETEVAAMSETEKAAMEEEFLAAVPSEEELADLSPEEREEVGAKVDAAAAVLMDDAETDDMMPETGGEPVVVSQGQFMGADNFHQGSGQATIYQLPEGGHVLRFEDFDVTNGPELHVFLVKNPNPANSADVGTDYLDLGSLKGNLGNQNYDIPERIDVSQFQSVVIYCVPFQVVFASAGLN